MNITRTTFNTWAAFFLILSFCIPFLASAAPERSTERPQADRELRGTSERAANFRTGEIIVKFAGEERPRRLSTRGLSVAEAIDRYRSLQGVTYAEPNYIAHAYMVPNDSYYDPFQWNFDNDVHGGVGAEEAWETTIGEGVVVAVIDTGVAYEDYHAGGAERYEQAPDLAGTNFVPGYDFVYNDTHANDDEGHGTHVAGTIAGTTNNGEGVAGLAYGASIMPIKVLDRSGGGTYFDVADGIRFAADNGADVINLSLGGPVGASYLEEAIAYAYGKGVTIVAASGNDGANAVGYPAAYDEYVIAVGATRFDETVTNYSNTGAAIDLVAPGGDLSVDQNGDGYGDGILQQTLANSGTKFGYYFYQGTSMATPHVAAAAAMVIAAGKASTPAEVQALLESTAEDLGPTGFDTISGHGLVDLAAALGGATPPPPEPTPNQVPIADAGSDQTLNDTDNDGSETVTLNGSNSTDADGTIEMYEWHIGTDHIASGVGPTVFLPVGQHIIFLTVTDNVGASSTDSVVVDVEAYVPPPDPEPEPELELEPEPEPEPPNGILFSDDFENRLSVWSQGPQGDWYDSRRESFTGRYAAALDGRTNDAILVSPLISIQKETTVRISFAWLIDRSVDSGEYLAFDISTDGGVSWTEYARLRGEIDPQDTWLTESIDLTLADDLTIRFRGTLSSGAEDGYVDTVSIEAL